ncbi:hypothetical protein GQ600_12338 [Phytophthora cactorum]|nr:hypothetical protein GQ600_12338 [Phytophthora cactorum]
MGGANFVRVVDVLRLLYDLPQRDYYPGLTKGIMAGASAACSLALAGINITPLFLVPYIRERLPSKQVSSWWKMRRTTRTWTNSART